MKSSFLHAAWARSVAPPWNNEKSIREELFSIERLEQHAATLAVAQPTTLRPVNGRSIAARLKDNESVLLNAYRAIATAVDEHHDITPAAEWLLDNYHVVEEQIREIRDDLPASYYRELPKLIDGPFAGYPRIFGIAWAFVAHTDSRFDPEMLCRFVRAYQRVEPLTIGELWAVAITLRIVLVENLRRAARRIESSRAARREADMLADRLLGVNGRATEPAAPVLQPYNRQPLTGSFAVQLVQRLRDEDPKVTPALVWLEERLVAQGTTADTIVHDEHQSQGATNVTARNIITSMRLISDVDWTELFEKVSLVDDVLRSGSDFTGMDFPTRNLYRTAIEKIARGSKLTELEVARAALLAAGDAKVPIGQTGDESDRRMQDPGYHLIAGGRRAFEIIVGFRPGLGLRISRSITTIGIGAYVGGVVAATMILLALPLLALSDSGSGWRRLVGLAALGLIPAIDAAVALVNRGVTRGVGATILPSLELRGGIPPNLRTLLAVPILLTTRAALEEHIEALEIHHLASPEGELYFALLSDWVDAVTEHQEGDDALLAAAAQGIARLNHLYPPGTGGERFLLLHRRRVWNAGQDRWIGWERKRGKLHELNRLIGGATDTTFVAIEGRPPALPPGIRYVITLDADTRLPREAARRLVGKVAHPLNRPRFDTNAGRVVEGYGVLQPRVTPSLPIGHEGSPFQRVFSSTNGIDPYAAAVSDVYQDLFGEGSYAGKGIYDVAAFEAALDGRVGESTMLSHDLFEGTFARAGLVSDVEVVEEFPSRYDVDASRRHRWARGDWQLLPWIFGRGTRSGRGRRQSAIPLIGLWKMVDNLRRTLSAPACVLAVLAGFALPLRAAFLWEAFVLSTIVLPTLLPVITAILPRRAGITVRSHLFALGQDLQLALTQAFFLVTFLAHQAWSMTDAILRTLNRLFITRRRLLEWVTAAQAKTNPRLDFLGFYRQMAGSVIIAAAAAIVILLVGNNAWVVGAPFVALWIAAPAIARWSSLSPTVAGRLAVSEEDTHALRLIARRTWRFFETFVTAADHMLPPDNFQEDPKPTVAHRTSPTNIGLYLLSTVSARDFGWVGTIDAAERLEATLATMDKLQRFHGHFYNWYDTQDLRPLDPRYVSSVDSGNLAGHLIALASACREWITHPIADLEVTGGIDDALKLTEAALRALPDDSHTHAITRRHLDGAVDAVATLLRQGGETPRDLLACLTALEPATIAMVDIARTVAGEYGDDATRELLFWAEATHRSIDSHRRDVLLTADARRSFDQRLAALEATSRSLARAMEFGFLLNPERKLLSIGYVVGDDRLDPNCYDLLASEARLASFVAIAKGDVPARHWFRLGRAVTPVEHSAALISWSGSMFEYLMPPLVLRAPVDSLLEHTSRLVVRRQIAYGATLGLPWGISESAYNARDLEFTYQYSNFGVPGLGLKRGLRENAVIAPYATALATMVDPEAAARNFVRLAAAGALGSYGFYEALDYTPTRLPEGKSVAIVRAFMAHHQGMTIVGIANALLNGRMRERFHAEPIIQATELLLQERTPRDVAVDRPRAEEVKTAPAAHEMRLPAPRRFNSAHAPTPRTHLLSNGSYAVMLTGAGSGYSRWHQLAVTRWREDIARDDWGSYIFLRDIQSGDVWSAGFQPAGVEPDSYEVTFTEDRAAFVRRDGAITTTLEILVSPEDDAEVRRVTIANAGSRARDIELTSYAELVLASPQSDTAHPAFSKMFVQTEYVAKVGALLATRRRRVPTEPEIWAAHLAVVEGTVAGEPEVETDRARFLGRGRDIRSPIAVMDSRPLSGTVGTVLDPIFALRRRVKVPAGGAAHVAFWTVVARSRGAVMDLVDKHHDTNAFERAATLAWTQMQVQLRHLDVGADEASLFQRLAGHVIYADASMRPPSDTIRRGSGGRSALWAQSISGDLPIVLVRIDDVEDVAIVRQLLRAHEYWRMKHLAVDLVILNERGSSYVQDLQNTLEALVRTSQSRSHIGGDQAGGAVFVLRADLVSAETRAILPSVAHVELVGRRGTLADQLNHRRELGVPGALPPRRARVIEPAEPVAKPLELEFFNGLGGFGADGREYVTVLDAGQSTPAPWINVIANPAFGFHVAVEGCGYTWSINSRENQLTPWSNDPVSDRPGEVFYVRDEDSGALWGPTALPIRDPTARYIARHGQGYSRFEHTVHGIAHDLLQYVPLDASIKISRLTLRNLSGRTRRLSVTTYVEWVLGLARAASAPFVMTEIDPETGAMFARNPWSTGFDERVAFTDLAGRQTACTGDRREFLGRNGTLDNPAALGAKMRLSNSVGAGLDPCGVLQARIELEPDSVVEIVFFLGEAATASDARSLLARYRAADLDAVFQQVVRHWDDVLGTIQVKSPDRSMDILLNRWLLYQTLACRMWARAAFYQASGAYGFRDQLQDGMALVLAQPAIARDHLLRAAGRQFAEGDVQHWWLAPAGQGVRTRVSDDRIWLAYAAQRYIDVSGDIGVLDELIPFLEGRALGPGEDDAYFQPTTADETASLFEHCARGLDRALDVGEHGLPLIGTGDWNDGFNRVGVDGRGESVWLGWFLYAALAAFAPLAQARGETGRAAKWLSHMAALKISLERSAWDGDWYRRGYFDDGTPIGSATNEECRIDSIAQSWAVISRAGDPARSRHAMAAVGEHLIRNDERLALLFTPPFDKTSHDPGYIKGYPPGIRENGGQYTHAAAWSVIALAMLGEGNQAASLFSLINPINSSSTRAGIHRYRVEPYVVAADIYSTAPHVGRGGWTWYTGSAGWLYQAGIEAIFGFRLRGSSLILDPCIPAAWPKFEIAFRYRSSRYEISVENPHGVQRGIARAHLDGEPLVVGGTTRISLTDDRRSHTISVVLG